MAEAAYAFVVYVVSSGPCERLFSCEVDGRQSYLLWIRVGERVLCLQRIELRLEAGAVYVYTSFSGEVAGFLRRLALRNLYLLDDSLGAALDRLGAEARDNDRRMSAGAAAIVTVSVMVALGYFVHPTKSVLVPALVLRWLGLLVRFGTGVFSVPEDKAVAISTLLHEVLREETIHFKTLERVVGKLDSLSLAAPGILIKLRQLYAALTSATRSGLWEVRLTPLLRAELEECLAMDCICGQVEVTCPPHGRVADAGIGATEL